MIPEWHERLDFDCEFSDGHVIARRPRGSVVVARIDHDARIRVSRAQVTVWDHDQYSANDFMGFAAARSSERDALEKTARSSRVARARTPSRFAVRVAGADVFERRVRRCRRGPEPFGDVRGSPPAGVAAVPLKELAGRVERRGWFELKNKDYTDAVEPTRGDVELACLWHHDPKRVLETPPAFLEAEAHPGRPANCLKGIALRAINVPPMDFSLLKKGSADPFLALTVADETTKTKHVPKTLRPTWLEPFDVLAEDCAGGFVDVRLYDHDAASGDDLIGNVSIELDELLSGREPSRRWYDVILAEDVLDPNRKKRPPTPKKEDADQKQSKANQRLEQKKRMDAKRAEDKRKQLEKDKRKREPPRPITRVELCLRMCHDPRKVLELPPGFLDQKTPKHKAPNELRVVVVRARNLPVMDFNRIGGGGSADPFVELEVEGIERRTKVLRKTLRPRWMELLTFPIDDLDQTLRLECLDEDEMSAADFVGRAEISLRAEMTPDKEFRAWRVLDRTPRPGSKSGHRDGDAPVSPVQHDIARAFLLPKVELAMRFVHNPALVLDLPRNALDDAAPDRKPNEIRLVVARGRNLPVMDRRALLHHTGGSTDPYVCLEFDGDEVRTPVKRKDLDPVWNEVLAIPVEMIQPGECLNAQVLDHNDLSGPELIGSLELPLLELAEPRTAHRAWWSLRKMAADGALLPPTLPPRLGKLEVALRWVHNPKLVVPVPKEFLKDKSGGAGRK